MIQLPAEADSIPSPVAFLGDSAITDPSDRPVRYFDHFCLPPGTDVRLCVAARFRTDESYEFHLRRLKNPRMRHWIMFASMPFTVLRNWRTLRQARAILCTTHHFWFLIFLWRLGVFPVNGKCIQTVFFRQRGFERKLAVFAASPIEFEAGFAVREQIRLLEAQGCPSGRLQYVPWKIDTKWFSPCDLTAAKDTGEPYMLCLGDVRRDEALILKLIATTPIKIIRVGRSPALKDIYGAEATAANARHFDLRINVSHPEYRALLRGAALVLLPILPCDEPAGLTAALETLACARPLLANESLGVGPLLRECKIEAVTLLPDLDPETWRTAAARILANPEPNETWQSASRCVRSLHSLNS